MLKKLSSLIYFSKNSKKKHDLGLACKEAYRTALNEHQTRSNNCWPKNILSQKTRTLVHPMGYIREVI
jgi:hypothetical protein